MPLSLDEIRAHWQSWASSYGTDLRATTRTSTAKVLELDALQRALTALAPATGQPLSVLEAGCGNGHNCLHLARIFPHWRFSGFDYVAEMVSAAIATREAEGVTASQLTFFQDDVLKLAHVATTYDVVMTVRCLINLNPIGLQLQAITKLAALVAPGGALLMIENSQDSHGRQNRARELAGLPPRAAADFNLFFDEPPVRSRLDKLGFTVVTEDFSSLHDLVLYVLAPLLNEGKLDYAHPMVEAATKLSCLLNAEMPGTLGAFGQNCLFICRKAV